VNLNPTIVSALVRRDLPQQLNADGRFELSSLTSELAPTLPRWADQLGIDPPEADHDTYWNLSEEIIAGAQPHHRVFGWPKQIQGDMTSECHLVTNGIYCGDARGDPTGAKQFHGSADDWMLPPCFLLS